MLRLVATHLPAAGVARLRHTRVVGSTGWIVGERDTYLPDHSWYGEVIGECPIYSRHSVRPTARLGGVTLSLCSDWDANYGHVIFDALPRLHLFEKAGYTWDDVSQILVPALGSDGMRDVAELCQFPKEKLVALNNFPVLECEELIAPTFPSVRRNCALWVPQFWQSKEPRSASRGRRLFISRRGSKRTLQNEDELAPVLEEFGFETVVSTEKSIRHSFSEAEIIIGPHGAALADIVFCNPGSVLIELTPPGHIFPYYYTAADSAGLEYFSLLGEYRTEPTNPMAADFTVSQEILRNTIASAEIALRERHDCLPS